MRTITLVISLFLVTNTFGQSTIDKAFSQYSGKTGFTSVSITSELFQLLSMVDAKNEVLKQLSEKIVANNNSDLPQVYTAASVFK